MQREPLPLPKALSLHCSPKFKKLDVSGIGAYSFPPSSDEQNTEQKKLISYVKENFSLPARPDLDIDRRFYLSVYVDGTSSELQIDTGADYSVIGREVIDVLFPTWRSREPLPEPKLKGVSGEDIKLDGCRMLEISLDREGKHSFTHPFCIMKSGGQFLLSGSAFYQERFGIEWDKGDGLPWLVWKERTNGSTIRFPISSSPRLSKAENFHRLIFAPGETKRVEFSTSQKEGQVIIGNVADQRSNHHSVRDLLVTPSLSHITNGRAIALVKNMSYKEVLLRPRYMKATAELYVPGETHSILDPSEPEQAQKTLAQEFNQGDLPMEGSMVTNLSISSIRRMREEEASFDQLFHANDHSDLPPFENYTVNLIKMMSGLKPEEIPPGGRELSEEEKEDLVDSMVASPEDWAEFDKEPGADLGFDFGPEKEVWEQFDLESVEERFRPLVRKLIEEHIPLFARNDMDCGDISRTLGTYSLPLKKPLPLTSHRTYRMQGKKRQDLKTILSMMLRNNLIRRIKSASFSSPIFLLAKKDKNALPRLLADVRLLNEHLLPIQQLVPKIQSLLEGMGEIKPVLFSSLDLASAFFSMVPDARARKALVLSCEFGLFEALVGVQGVSSIPGLFSEFIYRALHLDLKGNPDPISHLLGYLDDVLAFSPFSRSRKSEYKDLINDIKEAQGQGWNVEEWQQQFKSERDLLTACDHYLLLDRIFSRLQHHNFRVKINKLRLFQDKAAALGVIVDSEGMRVDPKRVDKILDTPFPTTLKSMQSYCGFLASIGLYSSSSISQCHGVLSELTSSKKNYIVEDKHRMAFQRSKELLATEPLFLNFPDQNCPKLLYVDSSDILLGAVLLDVKFPPAKKIDIPLPFEPSVMRIRNPRLNSLSSELSLDLLEIRVQSKPNSSFFESLEVLLPLLRIGNVPVSHKLLRQAVLFHLESGPYRTLLDYQGKICWEEFLNKYSNSNSGMDSSSLIVQASAHYLERDIFVLAETEPYVMKYGGGALAGKKPPIWLGLITEDAGNPTERYIPLFAISPNSYSESHNLEVMELDMPYMDREEIFERLKAHVNTGKTKEEDALQTRVVGYMSKVISMDDRLQPIWKKEATALINGLGKFKPLIEASPAVLCLLDSQVVYFLSHNNLIDTNLKAKRMGTLLHIEYPNLMITAIRSNLNLSDKLSRLFSLPKVVKDSIPLSKLIIPDAIPEIQDQAYTVMEAREKVTSLGDLHQVKAISFDELHQGPRIGGQNKTLLENLRPIGILKERLSLPNILLEQQKSEFARNLTSSKLLIEDKDGIIRRKDEETIWIPPSLEGVALSYLHLLGGHVGWVRLYRNARRKYYFQDMKAKCRNLATTCQVCLVSNPGCLKRTVLHSVVSSHPMEIVTADLLEVDNIPGNKKHKILVICDYFTKAIFAYDLKSFSGGSFIEKFKEFLMATGMCTRLLIVDNATYFSNRKVLTFLDSVGIRKVEGNANHSQSRGLVESSIRILQTLLRKLLTLSPKYNYEDLLFLAPVLLNSSTNPITGYTPYEMLYGRENELSINSPPTRCHYRLFSDTVKDDLLHLRKNISARIGDTAEKIQELKDKTMRKLNINKVNKKVLAQGSIVFVKDFSIPRNGRARKFRPYYLKSPNIVISATPTSAVTMRLGDSFISRHHPDDLLPYKGEKKNHKLYEFLPQEVLAFLGKPLSQDSLLELAKSDQLDMIYNDKSEATYTPPSTRSSSKQMPTQDEIMEVIGDVLDENDTAEQQLPKYTHRRVRFEQDGE